jgi:hypothetical protein
MANISIKNSIKSGSLLVGNAPFDPSDFESIATTTVGAGGATTITFSSIPATYQHLQIRVLARTNRSAGVDIMSMRMNGDTGNNYSDHLVVW